MKIEVVAICVEDIKTGDCFKYNDGYWIKSNLSTKDGVYMECVALANGDQRWFKAGDKVEKVQAEFRIHA